MPEKTSAFILAATLAFGGAGDADVAHSKTNPIKSKSVPAMNGEIRELGVAVNDKHLDDLGYTGLVARHFNVVVPENAAKTSIVMPRSRWSRDYSGLDKIVSFASKNNLKMRGHPLVFGGHYEPSWINRIGYRCSDTGLLGRPISQAARLEMNEVFQDHIKGLTERYSGKIDEWDVVNEPLNPDGTFANNAYYRCFGKDYIPRAFEIAHAANKNAKLYINEINAELPGPKRDGLVKLARELLDQGVPLYGIGLQTHLNLDLDFDYNSEDMEGFKETLRIFRSMGLAVKLTEMDVSIGKNPTEAQYARQHKIFTSVIKACTEEEACVGASIWGADDKRSWLDASGTLAYSDGRLKPAHAKIVKMFERSNKPQKRTRIAKSRSKR